MFPLAENLKQYLLDNVPSAKTASGGDTIVCRCPYCGDSHKHSKSTHFYISLPDEDKPALYYCHLCHASGVFTHRTLIDLGCYDPDLAQDIYAHNEYIRNAGNYHNKDSRVKPGVVLKNDHVRYETLSFYKLDYINYRLGTKLGFEDCVRLKIVPNLADLLDRNRIQKYTRDIRILSQLDYYFIGFLSEDNGYVILRNISNAQLHESINKRYVNYKIFDGYEDTFSKIYVIPQSIDLNSTDRIRLHVAEGVFDILSIYLNLTHEEPGIYAAVCGSNYSSVISHFMTDMMIPNLEIHIYPDADQDDNKINKIVRDYDAMQVPIYIHRNITEGQKDFGVPANLIHDVVRKANEWV